METLETNQKQVETGKKIYSGKTGIAPGDNGEFAVSCLRKIPNLPSSLRQQNAKALGLWRIGGQSSGTKKQKKLQKRVWKGRTTGMNESPNMHPILTWKCWPTTKLTFTGETTEELVKTKTPLKQNKTRVWKSQIWGKCQLLTTERKEYKFESGAKVSVD